MSVLIQGCSSLVETTEQAPEDLDSLGKNIVDMVDVSANEKQVTGELAVITSPQLKQNLYLEQAQKRLADVPKPVLTQYKQALLFMKNKKWQVADELFDQVLISQPQLSGAYVNKALIAFHQGTLDRANAHLNNALAVNPNNPYAHQLKGQVARLNGEFAQAEKSYLEALAIWPEYPEAQVNLAILLELYRGRLLDARKHYNAYLVLRPDDVQVQRWLAGVEIKIKRSGLISSKESDDLPLNSALSSSVNASGVN